MDSRHHTPFRPTQPSPLFHKDTTLSQRHHTKPTHCDSEHKRWSGGKEERGETTQKGQNNTRGARTIRKGGLNPNTGQHSPRPRHSTGPSRNRKGGHQHADGDADIQRGVSNTAAPSLTTPPTTTTAPHHPRWPHPPPRRGGERTEDTPPHEQHRHTHRTRTPHTRQGTVHDMTAVLASTAMG